MAKKLIAMVDCAGKTPKEIAAAVFARVKAAQAAEKQPDEADVAGEGDLFPEPVHFKRPGTDGWLIPNWLTAEKLLANLEPTARQFAIFTLPDDSFVQCMGSQTSLTVEAREQHKDGTFTHWVFGNGPIVGVQATVWTDYDVDQSQVLTMKDAKIIVREFLEKRTLNSRYHRADVTESYKS